MQINSREELKNKNKEIETIKQKNKCARYVCRYS